MNTVVLLLSVIFMSNCGETSNVSNQFHTDSTSRGFDMLAGMVALMSVVSIALYLCIVLCGSCVHLLSLCIHYKEGREVWNIPNERVKEVHIGGDEIYEEEEEDVEDDKSFLLSKTDEKQVIENSVKMKISVSSISRFLSCRFPAEEVLRVQMLDLISLWGMRKSGKRFLFSWHVVCGFYSIFLVIANWSSPNLMERPAMCTIIGSFEEFLMILMIIYPCAYVLSSILLVIDKFIFQRIKRTSILCMGMCTIIFFIEMSVHVICLSFAFALAIAAAFSGVIIRGQDRWCWVNRLDMQFVFFDGWMLAISIGLAIGSFSHVASQILCKKESKCNPRMFFPSVFTIGFWIFWDIHLYFRIAEKKFSGNSDLTLGFHDLWMGMYPGINSMCTLLMMVFEGYYLFVSKPKRSIRNEYEEIVEIIESDDDSDIEVTHPDILAMINHSKTMDEKRRN